MHPYTVDALVVTEESEVKEGGLPCAVPSSPIRHFIALMICSATGGHIDVAYTAL